jgi:GntR family transcriptional regulator
MGAKTKSGQTPKAAKAVGRKRASAADGPLYVQVAQSLRDEIVSGRYPVGALLPTEDALREQFSVSRFTVREAMRRLRDEGLVSSRQGAGTIVAPAATAQAQVLNTISISDLLALGADSRLSVDAIRMVKLDGKQARRVGVDKGEEWLSMTGLRLREADLAPICWVEFYIHRDYAAIGRQLPRHSGAVFPLIEDVFAVSIAEVQQEISATVLSHTMAGRLQQPEGSAALEIRRVYSLESGKPAQITLSTHAASTYRHSMTMRRVKR